MIYSINGKHETNTSESYNKDIYVYKDNLIIPYINLQILSPNFNHPTIKENDRLNFAYLIFKTVKEMHWCYEFNNKIRYKNLVFDTVSNDNDYSTEYIDATNIFTEHYGYDFEIKFKEQYLYFSEDVAIKNGVLSHWIPIDTPNFKRNLSKEAVKSFFIKDNVPSEITELVGAINSKVLEILNII
jgi:hypothetical protein